METPRAHAAGSRQQPVSVSSSEGFSSCSSEGDGPEAAGRHISAIAAAAAEASRALLLHGASESCSDGEQELSLTSGVDDESSEMDMPDLVTDSDDRGSEYEDEENEEQEGVRQPRSSPNFYLDASSEAASTPGEGDEYEEEYEEEYEDDYDDMPDLFSDSDDSDVEGPPPLREGSHGSSSMPPMQSVMRGRREGDISSHSRRGKHDRSDPAVKSRQSHAYYAYKHSVLVQSYSVGRPCTSLCPFGRNCGQHITPKTLQACHEASYGTATSCDVCVGDDGVENEIYTCQLKQKDTMAFWRCLFAGFCTTSAADPSIKIERFTVDGIGPVCVDYCAAAYGITTPPRSQATLTQLLAHMRSGELAHRQVLGAAADAAPHLPALSFNEQANHAMDECIEWWLLWLELEDQMPNEPVIVHRVVVWQAVYENEYLLDMGLYGTAPALSIQRWTALRKRALHQLAMSWFGPDPSNPAIPAAKLSLRERASHSKFPPCPECEANKACWAEFRRDPNRT